MFNDQSICDGVLHIDYSAHGILKKDLFGVFFEDLNHAADGGLYAELIQNRDFEFSVTDNEEYTPLTAWEVFGNTEKVSLWIDEEMPVNTVNSHYLHIKSSIAGDGAWNTGYNCGIPYEEGKSYIFSCYAKNENVSLQNMKVILYGTDRSIYGEAEFVLSDKWERYEAVISCAHTDYCGRLAILLSVPGEICVDFVSLFPTDTFMSQRNGLRKDLACAIAEMKPRFFRFPGGCLVHCGSLDSTDRNSMYRWKNTLGNIENRPARSSNWHSHQTLGMGYYEYFLFSEQIGAKPIPVIPAGYDPHTQKAAEMTSMQEWIAEAVDLIEFANGPIESKWGSIRAKMGHPESFYMEYLAIGNEEQGDAFFERYALIQKAVREKYPEMKIICSSGPFPEGGDFENGWKWSRKENADIVDEHYYQTPEWFIANHHRYDDYSVNDPKVFLGEYASKGNEWFHALAEASYMIGLERNADKVSLACYAPMFCNVDYVNWNQANMIWFDNHRMILTPNYHVQKLFMNHQGDRTLPCLLATGLENHNWSQDVDDTCGEILFGGLSAHVMFTDITVKDVQEKVYLYREIFETEKNKMFSLGYIDLQEYQIHFTAKQLSEDGEGFQICFGKKNENNQMILSLGGWNQSNNTLDEMINGKTSTLCQYPFVLTVGKEYAVDIMVSGRSITIKIDGEIYQQTKRPLILVEPLYYSASVEDETGDLIVKIVNLTDDIRRIAIPLDKNHSYNVCRKFIMSGYDRNAGNTFGNPDNVKPFERLDRIEEDIYCYQVERESFSILRFSDQ